MCVCVLLELMSGEVCLGILIYVRASSYLMTKKTGKFGKIFSLKDFYLSLQKTRTYIKLCAILTETLVQKFLVKNLI